MQDPVLLAKIVNGVLIMVQCLSSFVLGAFIYKMGVKDGKI
ncbi:hypothetical protein [Prochlorococcus sp. ALOHA_ZT_50]|jgi:hypothetical protein|nr:hypothetical protein [Prochlorococcus sp. ALOHA_ZT_50]